MQGREFAHWERWQRQAPRISKACSGHATLENVHSGSAVPYGTRACELARQWLRLYRSGMTKGLEGGVGLVMLQIGDWMFMD